MEICFSGVLKSVIVSRHFLCLCICFYVPRFSCTSGKFLYCNTFIALRMSHGTEKKWGHLDANERPVNSYFFQNCALNFTQATTYLAFSVTCLKPFQIRNIENKTYALPTHFSPLIKLQDNYCDLQSILCTYSCCLPIVSLLLSESSFTDANLIMQSVLKTHSSLRSGSWPSWDSSISIGA